MPWFDLPLDQLREYRMDTAEPPELDLWWQLRLAQARAAARPPALTRYEADIYTPVEVYDTEFSGAVGDRIRAWYLRPADADGQTRVVVKFIGYGGGRGMPAEHALLPALGYAVFGMHQILPGAPIFPDLSAVERTMAHLSITARTGITGRMGPTRTASAIAALRPSAIRAFGEQLLR